MFWLAGPGDSRPPGPALLSGDAELVSGDEGVGLHGEAQVGEPGLAVDGLLAVVAGVGLAGHRAAEAGSPVCEGVEGVPAAGEGQTDLLAAVGEPGYVRGGQAAVFGVLQQVSGDQREVGQGLGPGDVVGNLDRGVSRRGSSWCRSWCGAPVLITRQGDGSAGRNSSGRMDSGLAAGSGQRHRVRAEVAHDLVVLACRAADPRREHQAVDLHEFICGQLGLISSHLDPDGLA